jgi:hypothetical protein
MAGKAGTKVRADDGLLLWTVFDGIGGDIFLGKANVNESLALAYVSYRLNTI